MPWIQNIDLRIFFFLFVFIKVLRMKASLSLDQKARKSPGNEDAGYNAGTIHKTLYKRNRILVDLVYQIED